MSWDFSENIGVQESAGDCLRDKLGWNVVYAYDKEVLGENGTFGRKSYKEILLVRYLKQALERLNPWINETQVNEAVNIMLETASTDSLLQINEKKYSLILDGISVTVKKSDGTTDTKKAAVIDFNNSENNHFLAVKELKIHGELHRRRTDIVGFVNGIPLLFVELKRFDVDVEDAYTKNYSDYLDTIPKLFHYNAFLMLSNGDEAKVGTLGSPYKFFHEWKRLKEDECGAVDLETMLLGICNKRNFLDLVENFILYDKTGGHTVKILARNHQYLGVNAAVEAYANRKLNDGKLGVFWHTQGTGKSYSMLFMAKKIQRKFTGSPTFLILTDREELNNQISRTFKNCGLITGEAADYIAKSGDDLLNKKLKSNAKFIFSLIHKFNDPNAAPIIPDHDIIIMSDEAHRTQYGIFAANMQRVLPTASRIGFTGTPLFSHDDITRRTFGEYVSKYDFSRAVEDGATVPLFYENRGEKLKIENPSLTEEIYNVIEEADLDDRKLDKLEGEIANEIHLLIAEPRLRAIAKDFVNHYSYLWTTGKAMFVCLRREVCVRMYNYVQEYWQEKIKEIEAELKNATQQEAQEIERKLTWMRETEMAAVFSQEQNEVADFKAWGLDVAPHREKMVKRELDIEFKDENNPLRIVFVCAMWLTGFDVKPLSCLYLDKPLKDHTLMQTIARANRVCDGKENGLIIDYIGVVKALRKALAKYTVNVNSENGTVPTRDKGELIARILQTLEITREFLSAHGVDLQKMAETTGFNKQGLRKEAAEAVSATIRDKKAFQTYAADISNILKYLDYEDIDTDARKQCESIIAVNMTLKEKRKYVNTTEIMKQINDIINEHVSVEELSGSIAASRKFDISKIDFEFLRVQFETLKTPRLMLKDLQDVIQSKLDRMLFTNKSRIDYYERYQKIIEEYNSEQNRATIEKTFDELMKLVEELTEEEKRYTREGFDSEEELAIFDMLFKEGLSKKDIETIKKVSVDLLSKIKNRVAELDHWTEKEETRAGMSNLIRDELYELPEESYPDDKLRDYRDAIYEYVCIHYPTAA